MNRPLSLARLALSAALLIACATLPARAQSPEIEADRWYNLDGEDAPTLEALRGRAVLIEFWATW